MPNAAGEWRTYDADDNATYPSKDGEYLVQVDPLSPRIALDTWGENSGWLTYEVISYACIVLPEVPNAE